MYYIYFKILIFFVGALIVGNDFFLVRKKETKQYKKLILLALFIFLLIDNLLKII